MGIWAHSGAHTCTHAWVRRHVHVHPHAHHEHTSVGVQVHTGTRTCAYIHTQELTRPWVCRHTQACMPMITHVHVRTDTRACTGAQVHKHTGARTGAHAGGRAQDFRPHPPLLVWLLPASPPPSSACSYSAVGGLLGGALGAAPWGSGLGRVPGPGLSLLSTCSHCTCFPARVSTPRESASRRKVSWPLRLPETAGQGPAQESPQTVRPRAPGAGPLGAWSPAGPFLPHTSLWLMAAPVRAPSHGLFLLMGSRCLGTLSPDLRHSFCNLKGGGVLWALAGHL